MVRESRQGRWRNRIGVGLTAAALAIAATVIGFTFARLKPTPAEADPITLTRACQFAETARHVSVQPPSGNFKGVDAELVVDGLDTPTDVTQLPGSEFLLVTEKPGRVVAVFDGEILEPPILDIEDKVANDWNEQGLLSIESHPDFADTCELFLFYTDLNGDSNLVSVVVQGGARPAIDTATIETILQVPQDHQYHQSGSLTFGPDGYLWVSIGDGGLKHPENSQNPHTLKGSILRLDVDVRPYTSPIDNPFVMSDRGRQEVWAYGVRNPWRISIDPPDGLIFVPDTGDVISEEINILPLSAGGENLGWPVIEGDRCIKAPDCLSEGMTAPVYKYDRDTGCAIVGGEVYRGTAIPELIGHYFFGDFCRGWVKTIVYQNGVITSENDWPDLDKGSHLTSFGSDARGELYFTNFEGELWKIVRARD